MTTSKARAEAAPRNDYAFHKVRYRNWLSVVNPDSGVWLTAGASPKIFEMSNDEFVSAVCRRNTVEDPIVPNETFFSLIHNHIKVKSRERQSLTLNYTYYMYSNSNSNSNL